MKLYFYLAHWRIRLWFCACAKMERVRSNVVIRFFMINSLLLKSVLYMFHADFKMIRQIVPIVSFRRREKSPWAARQDGDFSLWSYLRRFLLRRNDKLDFQKQMIKKSAWIILKSAWNKNLHNPFNLWLKTLRLKY